MFLASVESSILDKQTERRQTEGKKDKQRERRTGRRKEGQTERKNDGLTERRTKRQKEGQIDREKGQIDRKKDKETERRTDRKKDKRKEVQAERRTGIQKIQADITLGVRMPLLGTKPD